MGCFASITIETFTPNVSLGGKGDETRVLSVVLILRGREGSFERSLDGEDDIFPTFPEGNRVLVKDLCAQSQ